MTSVISAASHLYDRWLPGVVALLDTLEAEEGNTGVGIDYSRKQRGRESFLVRHAATRPRLAWRSVCAMRSTA